MNIKRGLCIVNYEIIYCYVIDCIACKTEMFLMKTQFFAAITGFFHYDLPTSIIVT